MYHAIGGRLKRPKTWDLQNQDKVIRDLPKKMFSFLPTQSRFPVDNHPTFLWIINLRALKSLSGVYIKKISLAYFFMYLLICQSLFLTALMENLIIIIRVPLFRRIWWTALILRMRIIWAWITTIGTIRPFPWVLLIYFFAFHLLFTMTVF